MVNTVNPSNSTASKVLLNEGGLADLFLWEVDPCSRGQCSQTMAELVSEHRQDEAPFGHCAFP